MVSTSISRRRFLRSASGLFVPALFSIGQARAAVNPAFTMDSALSAEPPNPPSVLGANLFAWYRSDRGLNYDGSNLIYDNASTPSTRAWLDYSGNGNHLSASTSAKGERLPAAINGKDAVRCSIARTTNINTAISTLTNAQVTVYLLWRQITTANNHEMFNMNSSAGFQSTTLYQGNAVANFIVLYSGSGGAGNAVALNTWAVLTLQQTNDGTNSYLLVNKDADVPSSIGARNHASIQIGTGANGFFSDVDYAGIVISTGLDSRATRLKVISWLSWYGNLGL